MTLATPRVLLILIAGGLLLCGGRATLAKLAPKAASASVVKIEGTDQVSVTLLPEAAKRLDIHTAPVREQTVGGTRPVAGEVVKVSTNPNAAIVRVLLTEDEMRTVLRDEPAFIRPLARDGQSPRTKAQPLSGVVAQTLSFDSKLRRIGDLPQRLIHYEVDGADHGLALRQLVFVELAFSGGGEKRTTVPYAAVLYDAVGKTWVYTNPAPLLFIRQPIQIDAIRGDDVLLVDGPPVGTTVVTVGGAELYLSAVSVSRGGWRGCADDLRHLANRQHAGRRFPGVCAAQS
jgi:hypothetical protein